MKMRHPTVAEIDLSAIKDNVKNIRKKCRKAEIEAVVKADAYGHGAVEVSRAVLHAGATRLAVAHVSEGIALRKAGIEAPIHVFAGFFGDQIDDYLKYNLEFTVSSIFQWDMLWTTFGHENLPPIHLKFDTGMGRAGFPWGDADVLFHAIGDRAKRFKGLMTHFATSDAKDKSFANEQLDRFVRITKLARQFGLEFDYIHAANSGAILDMPDARFNLVRPGVILYGNYPSKDTSESIKLKPAMRWYSKILQIKDLQAGESVSYGATWRATQPTQIAVVPVGYADGYRRRLSGEIKALVNGARVDQVGRICMDLTMFNLGAESIAEPETQIVLLGEQGKNKIDMWEFCDILETIPYEITCMVGARVPRVYVS